MVDTSSKKPTELEVSMPGELIVGSILTVPEVSPLRTMSTPTLMVVAFS
jgi:hypothetical protein